MRLFRNRWDRVGGPTVRPLTAEDGPALRAFLDEDPTAHLFAAEQLTRLGLPRSSFLTNLAAASPFLGVVEDAGAGPEVTGVLWFGANLVPVSLRPHHYARAAQYVTATRREISSVFGPAEHVLGLWNELGPLGHTPFDLRPDQPLLALDAAALAAAGDPAERGADPAAAGIRPVRWAEPADLERLFPAAVAMFTEEVGYSPLERSPGIYEERLRESVASRRNLLATDRDGRVVFKADLGLVADGRCQFQGVWLAPELRGLHLSVPLLAAACRLALERFDEVSLYVNDYNLPARALYRSVGFRQAGTFATVLF